MPGPGSDYIATGSGNGRVCLWDQRKQNKPVTAYKAHRGMVWDVEFIPFSPLGQTQTTVSCGEDGSVVEIDFTRYCSNDDMKGVTVKRGPEVKKLCDGDGLPYTCVSMDKDSDRMFVASDGGVLRFYTWIKDTPREGGQLMEITGMNTSGDVQVNPYSSMGEDWYAPTGTHTHTHTGGFGYEEDDFQTYE
mmetsp:Transcript_25911/g.50708  ORF Transcript_25911/g.50708 Transcript_25911/m.50708 type:complete len:190 (-) Transcript_25911:287-856(-)